MEQEEEGQEEKEMEEAEEEETMRKDLWKAKRENDKENVESK